MLEHITRCRTHHEEHIDNTRLREPVSINLRNLVSSCDKIHQLRHQILKAKMNWVLLKSSQRQISAMCLFSNCEKSNTGKVCLLIFDKWKWQPVLRSCLWKGQLVLQGGRKQGRHFVKANPVRWHFPLQSGEVAFRQQQDGGGGGVMISIAPMRKS